MSNFHFYQLWKHFHNWYYVQPRIMCMSAEADFAGPSRNAGVPRVSSELGSRRGSHRLPIIIRASEETATPDPWADT
jgi:hypothetical protein